ncbi:MAG: helix-turn-helix transcriptional regulator [Clostridiales bacterium]|nr:helix-turn-helix transcriptional regulator [Clostridiales bacterium]
MRNIRRKLIISIYFFILVFAISNFLLFSTFVQKNHIEQLKISNDNLINQIGFSYETVIKNVKTTLYKTTLADTSFTGQVQGYENSFDDKNNVFQELYNIVLASSYIQSAYLYIPAYNQVFSTSNNINKLSSYDKFSDQVVFSKIKEIGHYTLGPRNVENDNSKKQVLSIVSSLPLHAQKNTAFLVMNVDLDRLRYDMLTKFGKTANMRFYVDNMQSANTPLDEANDNFDETLAKSARVLFKNSWSGLKNNDIIVTSVYDSKPLKLTFILETNFGVEVPNNYIKNLSQLLKISVFWLIFSLIAIIFFTIPINRMETKYDEKLWEDFITDDAYFTDDIKKGLADEWIKRGNAKFGMIVLLSSKVSDAIENDAFGNYKTALYNNINSIMEQEDLEMKIITTGKNLTAIAICYANDHSDSACYKQHMKIASMLYEEMDGKSYGEIYLGISTIGDHFNLLPSLYKECVETFEYRLISDSNILYFVDIENRKETYSYPSHFERQILNSLSGGCYESCKSILDDFFLHLMNPDLSIDDNIAKDSIYRLETSILKEINKMSILVEYPIDINISTAQSIENIKTYILKILEEACLKVIKNSKDEKAKLHNEILDYIDKHYTQTDINLNKVADIFNLNRNYISNIINEMTGRNYTDYINYRRIDHAKQILQDERLTVKEVAERAGFDYPSYFIKVFKNIEGITPGEYRSSL